MDITHTDTFRKAQERVVKTDFLKENRHFSERVFRHDGTAFFPMMDYTPTGQLYHQQLVRKNGLVYGVMDMPRDVTVQNGWLYVNSGCPHNKVNEMLIGDPAYSADIVRRDYHMRTKLENMLSAAPHGVDERRYVAMFNAFTSYGSQIMDMIAWNSLPRKILDKRSTLSDEQKNKVEQAFLYPPDVVPYYEAFRSCLLHVAKKCAAGNLHAEDVDWFTSSIGYMDRNDILPCRLEETDNAQRLIEKQAEGRTPEQLDDMLHEALAMRIGRRNAHARAHQQILDVYSEKDKHYEEARNYLPFLAASMNFNEANRRLRTGFFRFSEQWMRSHNHNPRHDRPPEECYALPTPTSVADSFS